MFPVNLNELNQNMAHLLDYKEYVLLEGKWEVATLLPCQIELIDPCRTVRASTTVEGC